MPQTKGGPRYALMVELKSSYYIEIVKVGARWYGGKKRSVKGYERTLSHEQLHVQEFQSLFDSILKSFSEGGLHTREKCNEKRNEAIEKFNKSKSEWNYQKMNQATHSGKSWDEWRRSNGHSETSEELW